MYYTYIFNIYSTLDIYVSNIYFILFYFFLLVFTAQSLVFAIKQGNFKYGLKKKKKYIYYAFFFFFVLIEIITILTKIGFCVLYLLFTF